MWRYRNKGWLFGWETGVNLDCKSATQQNYQTLTSLKDTDKGLTHISRMFLQKVVSLQMKTADHKNIDPRLVETRKIDDAWNFIVMPMNPRSIHELIMPCSLNAIKLLTTHSRVDHNLEGISPLWSPLPGKAIKATLLYFTQTLSTQHQWREAEFQQYHLYIYGWVLYANSLIFCISVLRDIIPYYFYFWCLSDFTFRIMLDHEINWKVSFNFLLFGRVFVKLIYFYPLNIWAKSQMKSFGAEIFFVWWF